MVRAQAVWIALAALAAGCNGAIMDPGTAGGRAGDDGCAECGPGVRPDGRDAECSPDALEADTTPARILTRVQYDNAIRDLLGEGLPHLGQPTVGGGAFDNSVAGEASAAIVPVLQSTSEAVAREAIARGYDPGCAADLDERACAASFVRDFGRRAFRRPVRADEEALLLGLYDTLRDPDAGAADHRAAIEGLLTAMLQMPPFLYRIEGGIGRGAGRVPLDGFEMASRLSFFLWNTIPDEGLLDAAEAGELDTDEGVRRTAGAMLDDPRARSAISHLYAQVFGLDRVPYLVKDPELHGDFTQAIGEAMRQETLLFLETVIFDRNGTVADLFDADFTMLNEPLARFYGVEGVTGDELRPVELDPSERSGLLTHGSFLAQYGKQSRTNPITRGVHVIRNVLCWRLPDPPADVPTLDERVSGGESVRDQLEAHRQPGCVSCHSLIDPIGLTFESYDTTGRHRTVDEGGNAVDPSTDLLTPRGEEVALADALELSRYVARSDDAELCAATSWFANAFARMPEEDADHCLIARLRGSGGAAAVPIREVLVGIATSEMFRFRINSTAEVCE